MHLKVGMNNMTELNVSHAGESQGDLMTHSSVQSWCVDINKDLVKSDTIEHVEVSNEQSIPKE